MSILDKFLKKEIRQPFGGIVEQVNRLRYSLGSVLSGRKDYIKEYKNWVYTCINARAEDVATIQLILKKGDKIVDKHEVLDLLNDVNPHTTKYDLILATQAFLDLVGNAYWFLARDNKGTGKVREIYMLSPMNMRIVLDDENPLVIVGYIFNVGKGEDITFRPDEILHFKNFNPAGKYPAPHQGVGIVESAMWAIETDNEARNWNYSFFRNNAKPDGLLTTPGKLSDTQYDRIEKKWKDKHQGSDKNGLPAIIEGGLSWQDISKTQKDMDFMNQRTFSRDEILSMFRVPKSIIAITDDVNRANAETSDYVFAKRTIKPLMLKLVTTLNEYLIKPEYGNDFELTFVDPTPEDRVQKVNEYSAGFGKWLSRNDIRVEEGRVPSENGNEFYGQFGEEVVDTVKETKSVNEINAKDAEKTDLEKSIDKVMDKAEFKAFLPKKKEQKRITDQQRESFKDLHLSRMAKGEKALKVEMKKYFNAQEIEVLRNLKSELKGLTSKEYKLKAVSEIIFDTESAVKAGISLITPYIKQFLKDGAGIADTLTGHNTNLDNPTSKEWTDQRSKFFSKSITETTVDALLKTINEGIEAQEGYDEIQARIQEVYKGAETYRVEQIARTETSASLNQGAVEAYKQAGINSLEWVAIIDKETSDECIENDGAIRDIGKAFPAGADQPPQHVNCRCGVVAVFE